MKNNYWIAKKITLTLIILSITLGMSLYTYNVVQAKNTTIETISEVETRQDAKKAQNYLLQTQQNKQKKATTENSYSIQGTIKVQATTQTTSSENFKEINEEIPPQSQDATPIVNTTTDSPTQIIEAQKQETPELTDTFSSQTQTTEDNEAPSSQVTQHDTITQTESQNSRENTVSSVPTSGMYIDGVCCEISTYSIDGGQVPTYTPYAYWWNTAQMASHNYYLVDNSNSSGLGQKVLALSMGDSVYLNGRAYHVTSSVTVYPNQYASDYFDFSHSLYIQTCYGSSASEGMRTVILD